MKTCSICHGIFSEDNYYKQKQGTYYSYCKSCYKTKTREYKWIKKGWDLQDAKKRYNNGILNTTKARGDLIEFRINKHGHKLKICYKCKKELLVANFYKDKDKYRSTCKSCKKEYFRIYNKEIRNERRKERFKTDINFKLEYRIRSRMRSTLNGTTKYSSSLELLGCSVLEARNHLEKQFKKGMSWDNYGKWHIDHIIPVSKFDLADVRQQRQCWHFSNLQPLWARDNMVKYNKLTNAQLKILI